MTEASVKDASANEAPAVELDEFAQQFKVRLTDTITELNGVNRQVQAMSGDPQQILEALRDTHTDNGGEFDKLQETITKFDKALSKAMEQRDELLKPFVEGLKEQSTENIQPMLDKASALTKTVNSGRNYLIGLYGEPALTGLPDVVKVKKSGNTGDGSSKRIRNQDWYVNGTLAVQKDAKGVERSSASAASKLVGVDVSVIQNAFWTAQGTKVATDYKPEVTFEITAGTRKDESGNEIPAVYKVYVRKQDDAVTQQGTTDPTENAVTPAADNAPEGSASQ